LCRDGRRGVKRTRKSAMAMKFYVLERGRGIIGLLRRERLLTEST